MREVAARTAHDSREVTQKTIYEQSFIQCMRLWETNAVVREFVCDGRLQAWLRSYYRSRQSGSGRTRRCIKSPVVVRPIRTKTRLLAHRQCALG
ncbi:MAG: hypothetical protein CM15mP120_00360 [Pseudomonadota bacterium]|nr:MAG: hypothetical protein CM15mP120_00360 [Pseudomonadota bacterium]